VDARADDDPALADGGQSGRNQLAGRGEDDRAVEFLRRTVERPACPSGADLNGELLGVVSPGRVNANTVLPSARATWATMCAEAPKP